MTNLKALFMKSDIPDLIQDGYHGNELRSTRQTPLLEDDNESLLQKEDDAQNILNIRICKIFQFTIFKPLFLLKLSLFLWFGGGATFHPFLPLYLKQRGLEFSELSVIFIITPMVQLLGSILLGLIADKIGKSKPILVGTLLASKAFIFAILLVPSLKSTETINFTCDTQQFNNLIGKARCGLNESLVNCEKICPENVSLNLSERTLLKKTAIAFSNLSISIDVVNSYVQENDCLYSVNAAIKTNSTLLRCNQKRSCSLTCALSQEENSSFDRSNWLVVISTFMILHLVFESLTYRFLDVTTMCLVKEYDKDFGRERFWAQLGVIVFSFLSGYIIKITSSSNEADPRNYNISIYMYGSLAFMSLLCILPLKVCIYPPGQKMWVKSLTLLKNPDVLFFGLVLAVLGTTWGFNNIYTSWYLEDLHGTSLLLGLVPTVTGLCGLPFLLTSNWWVGKLGSTNLFVLGLLALSVHELGLSIIKNPWWAVAIDLTSILHNILLWVAVIGYSHSLAPDGLRATLMASAGGIHYGLGKGTGSLLGGLLKDAYGGRTTFRIFACMCLTTAALYSIYLFIRRQLQSWLSKNKDRAVTYCKLEDSASDEDTEINTNAE